tara:strand:- start:317 stop:496 length:180 start_codon:yes stop_codon:yes gene_type:complete
MIKWLFYIFTAYFLYKLISPVFAIFRFSRTNSGQKAKYDVKTKLSKMDIQDAEFEEKVE